MASIFGDDGIEDLLNDNLHEEDELPGEEGEQENLFAEDPEFGEGGQQDESQNPVKVEPKKRLVRNPRPRLTIETLSGPRGIQTIENYFKDIKFRGKGYEKHDLDEIMRRLQHWAHRMYPTYKFDDVLTNIERLGKKRQLQVHMSRYRLGLLENMQLHHNGEVHDDDGEEDRGLAAETDEPFDEFDALLGEQIAISKLAPHTPAVNHFSAGNATTTPMTNSTLTTPSFSRGNAVMSTPYAEVQRQVWDDSDLARPLPTSQLTTPAVVAKPQLTAEQMALIAENRRKAQERLKAKQQLRQT